VPPHLEVVVEALLGQDVRALAVEGSLEEVLTSLVAAGPEGMATLLPFASRSLDVSGDCVRLIDELTVTSELSCAAETLLGDVLLADDYRSACRLAVERGVRVVSADGCIAWPEGKVSFVKSGSRSGEASSLARRRKIVELKELEQEAKATYDGLLEKSSKLEEELRAFQAQTLSLAEELAQVRGAAASAQDQAQRSESSLSGLSAEEAKLDAQIVKNKTALDQARPRTDTLANQLVELNSKLTENKAAIKELDGKASPLQREVVSLSQKLSDARLDVARLDERAAYAQRMLQTRESELKAFVRKNDEANERIIVSDRASKRLDPLLSTLGRLVDSARLCALRLEEQTTQERASSHGLAGQVAQATQAMREAHDAFDAVTAQISEVRIEKGRLEVQVDSAVKAITEERGVSLETALSREPLQDRTTAQEEAGSLERRIKNLGTINPDAAQEYEVIAKRHEYLSSQLADMRLARSALVRITNVIDDRMRDDFLATFNQVNDNFARIFAILFPGGQAHLSLVDPDDLENTGVDVNAQPVGKRVRKMSLLSGGEKSMTAMALLFAVYGIRRTPFYILDEVEAALDDTNLRRLIAYLQKVRQDTQLIMITHQRRTMESADILYGVSMQADGITKVLSQKLEAAIAASKEE
ncbi:MAG: chromosome segregation protein SMC, partial [Coriobacteriia bacterium]|nr:chromosome segregation protein SMC [Coriobacteriia bacterium]